jgi:hypothetical protein
MLGLAAQLMMTVQGLLRLQTTGLSYGQRRYGADGSPLSSCRGDSLFYFIPPSPFTVAGLTVKYSDLLGLLWIASNIGLYL